MPILNNGKTYYPLEFGRMFKDGKTYYDRSARDKSWFYVDLRGSWHEPFIPDGASCLITADGNIFKTVES